MKTFKWTVPQPEPRQPGMMNRREYEYWARVRARGPEWFVVQKGLLFLLAVPLVSRWLAGTPISIELASACWMSGLCLGSCVWLRREVRFARSRDEGMRTAGDDLLD
jgi:hypothetical protein